MKYPVKEEGRPGVFLLDKETAKKIIKDKCKKKVHNFIVGNIMLGADREIKSFYEFIDKKAERIAIVIPHQMGHAIAVISDELYLFDVGNITEADLEVIK